MSVYHPILFGALYKLLRAKCFSCHNLRLSKTKTRVAAVKVRDGRKLALCGTREGEAEGGYAVLCGDDKKLSLSYEELVFSALHGDRYLVSFRAKIPRMFSI